MVEIACHFSPLNLLFKIIRVWPRSNPIKQSYVLKQSLMCIDYYKFPLVVAVSKLERDLIYIVNFPPSFSVEKYLLLWALYSDQF